MRAGRATAAYAFTAVDDEEDDGTSNIVSLGVGYQLTLADRLSLTATGGVVDSETADETFSAPRRLAAPVVTSASRRTSRSARAGPTGSWTARPTRRSPIRSPRS